MKTKMNKFKNECDINYHKGTPIISDNQYNDIFGDTHSLTQPKEKKLMLPYWMGSLNKIRTEDKLQFWIKKQNFDKFFISAKIDGVSALYFNKKLYTRGDGKIGTDITNILSYLKLPNILYPVRGELIIKRDLFENKYKNKFSNPRNLVAGLLNRKEKSDNLSDICFIAYEIIDSDLKPSEQFTKLKKDDFSVAWYTTVENPTIEILSQLMNQCSTIIDIDGLVIQSNKLYERNISGNPNYTVAFKKDCELNTSTTKVIKINWNVSKGGLLKPVVLIEPTLICSVLISKVTGFNAKYILDNKIGPGARIVITRSGDVIPHILKILEPCKKSIELPSQKWKGVDLISEDLYQVPIKIFSSIFSELKIKYINIASITKMYENGLDTLPKILNASSEEFRKIGFGPKMSNKIHNNISQGFKNISLAKLIGSSGVLGYGIGTRRVELLFKYIPDFINTPGDINNIPGFSEKLAEKIRENHIFMKKFIKEMEQNGVTFLEEKKFVIKNENENENNYVFSGFRDEHLENILREKGHRISNSLNKNSILIVKSFDYETTKIKKANQLGIKIILKDKFYP